MLSKHIHVGHIYGANNGEYREVLSTHQRQRERETTYFLVNQGSLGTITISLEQFAREAVCNMTKPADDDPLLTPEQAAERIGVARDTLAKWRVTGTPKRYLDAGAELPFVRMPRGVRYRQRDVEAFRETMSAHVMLPRE